MVKRTIFASRQSRWWLTLFIVLALVVVGGVVIIISAKITYTVTPEVEEVIVPAAVKIDLDITQPLFNLNIIPGKLLERGEPTAQRQPPGFTAVVIDGQMIVYEERYLNQLLALVAAANTPLSRTEWLPMVVASRTDWRPEVSGRQFSSTIVIKLTLVNNFSLTDWTDKLAGLPVAEGLKWLQEKPGVRSVKSATSLLFLAKISQNSFGIKPRVVILLDSSQ